MNCSQTGKSRNNNPLKFTIMSKSKKILSFFMLSAYALASIGGFGYAVYGGSWPIAIAVVALSYMAFPKAKEYWKTITSL